MMQYKVVHAKDAERFHDLLTWASDEDWEPLHFSTCYAGHESMDRVYYSAILVRKKE